MKLERTLRLAASEAEVWATITDVRELAACIPGVELLGQDDSGEYLGAITFRTGPKSVRFEGRVKFTYDAATRSGNLEAVGADRRQASRAKAHLAFELDGASGAVELRLVGDISFVGALAEFAESGGVYVGEQLMDGFAQELSARLTALTAPHAETGVGAASIGGAGGDAPAPLRITLRGFIRQIVKQLWRRRRESPSVVTTGDQSL